MSNARKPKTPTPAARPTPPYRIKGPEELAFGELFRIHAATGVDVLNPVTRAHAIAACLWFAARDWANPLTWEETLDYDLDDVDLVREDEPLPDEETDEEEDPTESGGHETPSSVSSSD